MCTIDKFQETIDKLKKNNKSKPIPKDQFEKAMEKMNESVEKTREEYLIKENNSKNAAIGVIVR